MFICLAAGKGERMKPLTNYLHKAMIPFSGVPFLAYSLVALPAGSDVVLVVNYLQEQIRDYFGNHYKGRKITYLKQDALLGTGDALFQFSERFRPHEPITVWQADQLIFSHEIIILSEMEANVAICSDTPSGLHDLGFWKIKPETLPKLKGHFDGKEFRALPVLQREPLNVAKVRREKFEISFQQWDKIALQCNQLKQKFHTEFQ